MTARLVIVWIWSLSGGQREGEKPPTACQRSMGVGVREPSKRRIFLLDGKNLAVAFFLRNSQ